MSAAIFGPGAQRQAAREKAKADWVEAAYAGVAFPTGPNRPLPRYRDVMPNPRWLGDPNPKNKRVKVLGLLGRKEVRYHFTKGYRVVIP